MDSEKCKLTAEEINDYMHKQNLSPDESRYTIYILLLSDIFASIVPAIKNQIK